MSPRTVSGATRGPSIYKRDCDLKSVWMGTLRWQEGVERSRRIVSIA
jgi:hypothetical protein